MSYRVENAVIMAAGLSSRFAPISYEKPKALICVRGEILIERQIRQLQEAGIKEIIVVVGYKKEQFQYLEKKLGVKVIENKEYLVKNNSSSIYAAKDYLKNTYVCSADNYFSENPFEQEVDESYYSVLYAEGKTNYDYSTIDLEKLFESNKFTIDVKRIYWENDNKDAEPELKPEEIKPSDGE